jgi:REP element-mobilizing transposase RayT
MLYKSGVYARKVLCREGDVVENIHFTSEWFIDKRRAMPRQARLDALGTLHHVMIRGIEGKSIFRDAWDRKDFVARLRDLAKQTGTRILAWSLLGNHVPFLFRVGPGEDMILQKKSRQKTAFPPLNPHF